ncbi:hypothetical protein [Nostoc favosum]|uniref:Uncharacterized protein n=1 Tax=Nostoc favosum CHAB5714 TaxID=2780399 RepID=A0ABS8I8N4_9NOSO|nr:hypothetical protein [Nostoc favosum]MCC5600366.1 hypothetical protein [Nostoc favosum CHAB5714]
MTQSDEQKQCQELLVKLHEDIIKTMKEIPEKIRGINYTLNNKTQMEIVKQVAILQRIEIFILKNKGKKIKNTFEFYSLESKFYCIKNTLYILLENENYIEIAKELRHEIEYFLNTRQFFLGLGSIKNFFKRSIRDFVTPTKVLVGLAMVIPVYSIGIPLVLTGATALTITPDIITFSVYRIMRIATGEAPSKEVLKKTEDKITAKLLSLFDNSSLIIMVAFAGAFGSIVSIFIRLDQYKDPDSGDSAAPIADYRGSAAPIADYRGSAAPIIVGFAKPLIGTAFGILIFAIINSNIISFPVFQVKGSDQNSDAKYFFFFTLAFLVGFSERLANDIVRKAERTLSSQEIGKKLEETAEKTDKKVEETAEKTAEKIDKKVEETAEKIDKKVEETGEEIKEEVQKQWGRNQ